MAVGGKLDRRELLVLEAVVRRIDRGQPFTTVPEIVKDTGLIYPDVMQGVISLSPTYIGHLGFDRFSLVATEQGRQKALQGHEAPPGREPRPVRLFYSYSHEDERYRKRLEVHLAALRRQGLIEEWHDRMITAGREWKNDIDDHLEAADIILLLVSSDFLASDYAYNTEFKRALARNKLREARVVPIILRPTLWQETPIRELQVLPPDGRPVYGRGDRAWMDVAMGLRRVIKEINQAH